MNFGNEYRDHDCVDISFYKIQVIIFTILDIDC